MTTYAEAMADLALRAARFFTRHRERYLRAWIATYGVDPRDVELVEQKGVSADGTKLELSTFFARRKASPVTEAAVVVADRLVDRLAKHGVCELCGYGTIQRTRDRVGDAHDPSCLLAMYLKAKGDLAESRRS